MFLSMSNRMTLSLLPMDSIFALQEYLFKSANFEILTSEGLYSCLGDTREDATGETRQGSEWARSPSILCPSCYDISVKVVDTQVMISDFDVFFLQNQERTGPRISIELLPPEVSLSILSGLLHSLRDSG
jgi:hypothetical protein